MFLFHSLLIDALKFWFSEKCTWLIGRMSSFGGYRNTHFLWWIIWLKADLAILLSSLIEICIVPWSGSSTKTKKYKKCVQWVVSEAILRRYLVSEYPQRTFSSLIQQGPPNTYIGSGLAEIIIWYLMLDWVYLEANYLLIPHFGSQVDLKI